MCIFIDQMVLRKRFVFCYEQVLHVCVYIINGLDDGLPPSQQTNKMLLHSRKRRGHMPPVHVSIRGVIIVTPTRHVYSCVCILSLSGH